MKAYEVEKNEDEFEEELNSIYGKVEICGMEFPQGAALRELDPTAFRCALSDEPIRYGCGVCGGVCNTEEEAEECCKEGAENETV